MKRDLKAFFKTDNGLIVILSDFFLMGVIFHLIPFTRQLMPTLTPFVLFLSGITVLYRARGELNLKRLAVLVATYVITFALEAAGVATGKVFGKYSYGASLGVKLLEVPLVIGFNWVMIIFGLYTGLLRFKLKPVLIPFFTALLAAGFDFIMEPVAVALDYWSWSGGIIPLQNYIAWFLIALLCVWLLKIFRVEVKNIIPAAFVVIELVFFILLRLFYTGV